MNLYKAADKLCPLNKRSRTKTARQTLLMAKQINEEFDEYLKKFRNQPVPNLTTVIGQFKGDGSVGIYEPKRGTFNFNFSIGGRSYKNIVGIQQSLLKYGIETNIYTTSPEKTTCRGKFWTAKIVSGNTNLPLAYCVKNACTTFINIKDINLDIKGSELALTAQAAELFLKTSPYRGERREEWANQTIRYYAYMISFLKANPSPEEDEKIFYPKIKFFWS